MEIYLLKLILAHLIGDFFLQPGSWVKEKEAKKLKSDKLYLHVAIHIALVFVIFADLNVWKPAIFIGVCHFMIDALKLSFQTKKYNRLWFLTDQVLHVISIVFCWNLFFNGNLDFGFLHDQHVWLIATGAIFLTMPAAIIMRVIIARWIPATPDSPQSLQNAGQYIGILERLLIFLFVCTNHFEAVGFLLAAKSIFRFGDLKEAHDIKLTEYVLIGTLLSFGIAIVVAIFIKTLLGL